jgi:hypothetical protein
MDPHALMLMAPSTSLEEEEVRAEGSMAVVEVVEEDDGNNPVLHPVGEPLSFLTIKIKLRWCVAMIQQEMWPAPPKRIFITKKGKLKLRT